MERVSKNQFASSLVWKTINMVFSRGTTFVVSILLARMLEPGNYGLMTIWSTILGFGNVLVIGGIDTVLVQRKDTDSEDWSTAQIVCLFRAAILFVLLFLLAPFIGGYYESEILVSLLRAAGVDFFCQALITIYVARATRQMAFKRIFIADFSATVIGGGCAVLSVYLGASAGALLINTVLHRLAYALILLFGERKRGRLAYNKEKRREMTRLGYKAMANGLFDTISGSVSGLFTGKKWPSTQVGYSNRADKLTQMAGVETYNIISGLLLPTFSSYQQDQQKLKEIGRKLTAMSCYIMFPLMMGLAACSEEVIVLLYTDKWLSSAMFIPIISVYYAVNPIRQLCMQMNYSVGRYKTNLRIEFMRMILGFCNIAIMCIIPDPPLYYMSIAGSACSLIVAGSYLFSMKKAICYTVKEQMNDILPTVILSVVAVAPVYIIKGFGLSPVVFLLVAVPLAVVIYVGLSFLFRIGSFQYAIASVKAIIEKKKNKK